LGGYLPARYTDAPPLTVPPLEAFQALLDGTGEREISTTMAFVRILTALLKDKNVGRHVVPIVPDEARTFGMEGLFRQIGIYSAVGQLYTPQDADQLMSYREDKKGQMLEEGINEAGALCSWIAAGTAYANYGIHMVPFYIFYSMFGFQRVGDFIWAAGDMQTRGFLLGATAGRTTLAGEGLQHQDGHSQLLATTVPNCRSYDPTFAYELAVIIQDGMRRMYADGENVFYYITVMNENYPMPPMPEGVRDGILRGLYLFRESTEHKLRVTLLGSGTILRECLAAARLLSERFAVSAAVYAAPSFSELRREALQCERWNLLHPDEPPRTPYVVQQLRGRKGPFVAATDYVRNVPDQIRQWVPGRYVTLGTDGYGRSDSRAALRRHFEVDAAFIAFAALRALADDGQLERSRVVQAMRDLGVAPDKADPATA
ncbi:MAG: pyruvate dehydrogenase (acetyl-transferring), homodimeric type, partial [Steroidobacteraceae bacterium]|nr:pyruvate dehydrogenase (acetyl-transferring), homodimeric type [Steroidobacteraceae bacterium]MDW8260757.1 pyruvate dehydrogenase (acetyl-transferring), homodimeric type [Gammaproteobacteria bacterium]